MSGLLLFVEARVYLNFYFFIFLPSSKFSIKILLFSFSL